MIGFECIRIDFRRDVLIPGSDRLVPEWFTLVRKDFKYAQNSAENNPIRNFHKGYILSGNYE